MINRILLCCALVASNVAGAVSADVVANSSFLLTKVGEHPDVVEKKNQALLKGLRIREMVAEDGLQINLSTKSKLSIIGEYSDNAQRITDRDRSYIDGVVTAQKVLYDFGRSEFDISSEKRREKAAQLEYIDVYEQTMRSLLALSIDVARLEGQITSLDRTIGVAAKSIEELEFRFSSGVGTVVDVRRAQLLSLDLETERKSAYREHALKLKALNEEFNLSSEEIRLVFDVVQGLVVEEDEVAVSLLNGHEVGSERSLGRINHEKSALRSQIKSLRAAEQPQLSGVLTGVAYDVTRGVDEYELYGGVNLSMPLFDSGLSSSKKRSLLHQIQLQDDAVVMVKNQKRMDAIDLAKRYQQLSLQTRSSRERAINLQERLSQVTQKIAMTGEGLLSKLQTALELAEAERAISMHPYLMHSINIDYLALNEQLLGKMSVIPLTQ